ncbi:nuclear transcription factor Y subunit C-3-like isoform X2 [Tasmannia lanceolata]|uniref:nuclear transcription factor Y subunit C-3-like isoform X2 n=1 Tax=Tasmannia lanceolata TaxID=3420 RepID=UPI0040645AC6
MDPNHSLCFSSSSSPLTHVHNFMNVPPPMFPLHRHEVGGIATNSGRNMMDLQRQYMQMFWQHQMLEVNQISEFKQHQLPLARIKRIMKADEDVKMISADAPVLFSKACELFILDLTLKSWFHAEEKRRRTLQRSDIATAITRGEVLDFLLDIVRMDENQVFQDEEELGENWVGPESFPCNGMHFSSMHPNPFNQTLHQDYVTGQTESPHQFMVQQSVPSPHLTYEPLQ